MSGTSNKYLLLLLHRRAVPLILCLRTATVMDGMEPSRSLKTPQERSYKHWAQALSQGLRISKQLP